MNDQCIGFQEHHIKIMKVALAMTIIRQKPESISSYDFTLDLAQRLEKEEVMWRKRATLLEEELLRTRQDLLKYQLQVASMAQECSEARVGMAPDHHGMRMELDPRTIQGSLCSNSNEGSLENGLFKSAEREGSELVDRERIEAHTKFLTNVYSLIHSHKSLPAILVSDLQDTFKDTILSAIRGLRESLSNHFCCDRETSHFQNLLTSAITCITDFISKPLLAPVREDILFATISFVDVLLKERHDALTIQFLQPVMITVCGVHRILLHVVRTLTKQLCTTAQLLSSTLEGEASLSDCLIDAAEKQTAILDVVLVNYDSSKNFEDEVRFNMADELEDSFLQLSCSYPLLTYAVWRTISLLIK